MDFSAIFANGPVACGAVVDTDKFTPASDGFKVAAPGAGDEAPDAARAAEDAFRACGKKANQRVAAIVGACAGLLVTHDKLRSPGCAIAADPQWAKTGDDARDESADDARKVILDAIETALAVMVSGKVNYWKTNHHTGGSHISGFLRKTLDMRGIDARSAEDTHLIWIVTHWLDTKVALRGVGIRDVEASDERVVAFRRLVKLSDDAQKRIASNPAGTAKWVDVYVAIMEASTDSACLLAGPAVSISFEQAKATYDAIHAGSARYHMGSQYLCSAPRKEIVEWESQVVAWAFTSVSVLNPAHTILKAQVFANVAESSKIARVIREVQSRLTEKLVVSEENTGFSWAPDAAGAGAAALGGRAEY